MSEFHISTILWLFPVKVGFECTICLIRAFGKELQVLICQIIVQGVRLRVW